MTWEKFALYRNWAGAILATTVGTGFIHKAYKSLGEVKFGWDALGAIALALFLNWILICAVWVLVKAGGLLKSVDD
jgi:hypothetical protein